ncbi:Endonuclease/exonuclease/phosphatase [Scenedesmus sp. NREL 46B-D3]|nr:Endonuclease/exonuclease/phosphatase [Scenedesmus sp. NREL 46B-D3]
MPPGPATTTIFCCVCAAVALQGADHGPWRIRAVQRVCAQRWRQARPCRLPAKLAFLQALQERVDALLSSGRQVVAVGDFNIAAEPRDVHSAITWDTLYAQSELNALHQLTSTLTDTWRQLHPEQGGVYSVWDEKTSARAFNVGLRIDYALCSKQLLITCTRVRFY